MGKLAGFSLCGAFIGGALFPLFGAVCLAIFLTCLLYGTFKGIGATISGIFRTVASIIGATFRFVVSGSGDDVRRGRTGRVNS